MDDIDRQIKRCKERGKAYYKECKEGNMRVIIHNKWLLFLDEIAMLSEMAVERIGDGDTEIVKKRDTESKWSHRAD